jgi:hypothetical protein
MSVNFFYRFDSLFYEGLWDIAESELAPCRCFSPAGAKSNIAYANNLFFLLGFYKAYSTRDYRYLIARVGMSFIPDTLAIPMTFWEADNRCPLSTSSLERSLTTTNKMTF